MSISKRLTPNKTEEYLCYCVSVDIRIQLLQQPTAAFCSVFAYIAVFEEEIDSQIGL